MLVYAAVYCNFMLFAASYVKLTDKHDTEVVANDTSNTYIGHTSNTYMECINRIHTFQKSNISKNYFFTFFIFVVLSKHIGCALFALAH